MGTWLHGIVGPKASFYILQISTFSRCLTFSLQVPAPTLSSIQSHQMAILRFQLHFAVVYELPLI